MGMVRLRPPSPGGAAKRSARIISQHELLHLCHCQQYWECLLANRIAKHHCNMGMVRLRPPSPGGAAKRSAGIISQRELLHLCDCQQCRECLLANRIAKHLRNMGMVRLRPPSPGGAAKRSARIISQSELLHLCQCQQCWECLLGNRIAKHLCNIGMVRLWPLCPGGAAKRSARIISQHELLHLCHWQQCWECLLANRIAKHHCNMGMVRLRPPSPGGATKCSAGIISQRELLHMCHCQQCWECLLANRIAKHLPTWGWSGYCRLLQVGLLSVPPE